MARVKITISGDPKAGTTTIAQILRLCLMQESVPVVYVQGERMVPLVSEAELLDRLAALRAEGLLVDVEETS